MIRIPRYPSLQGVELLPSASNVMPWTATFLLQRNVVSASFDYPEPYRWDPEWRDRHVFRLRFSSGELSQFSFIDEWNVYEYGRPEQQDHVDSMTYSDMIKLRNWWRELLDSDKNP